VIARPTIWCTLNVMAGRLAGAGGLLLVGGGLVLAAAALRDDEFQVLTGEAAQDPQRVPGTEGAAAPDPVGSGAGTGADTFHWVVLTTWKNELERERRLAIDVLEPGTVYVSIIASIPVVLDWVEIGRNRYNYCDGPGDMKPIVAKILEETTRGLDMGIAAAAPQWATVASVVGSIIKKIPKLIERARQKKWVKWRLQLAATQAIAGQLGPYAENSPLEICRIWKYEGVWAGNAIELPLVRSIPTEAPIEIPWGSGSRDVSNCLDGEPPSVTISENGQIRVSLFKPDTTPPGACESRYDVTAMVI